MQLNQVDISGKYLWYDIEYSEFCTEQQLEILTACALGGEDVNRAFNQSITLHLTGKLSPEVLLDSLRKLIERNQALRTVFSITEKKYIVCSSIPVKPVIVNTESEEALEAALAKGRHADAIYSFNLAEGPLFRVSVFSHKDKHHLLLTLHHVVCDGWTLGLIIRELGELYSGMLSGDPKQNTVAQKYTDYSADVFRFYRENSYSDMKKFWIDTLKDYKPASALPYDHPRTGVLTYKSNHISYAIDSNVFRQVRSFAKEKETSVLITMASVFEVLRYKISGQKRFVTGIPTADQSSSGYDKLMGHCVNMLPVLCEIDGKQTFTDYLATRKKAYNTAFENRRVTFGSILKTLVIDRNPAAEPLIPVTFNIDRPLMEGVHFEGLEVEMTINVREYSSFEMIMNISRRDDDLVIECSYNSALFEDAGVLNFLKQYEYLAEQICHSDLTAIDSIPLYNIGQLTEQYKKWNDTACPHNTDKTIIQHFEKVSAEFPGETAIQFNDQKITYGELNSRVNRLCAYLRNAGLKQGDFAGVMIERSAEMVISLLAVMKSGAAYIPIDPAFPADRINYMLQDSGAELLLLEGENRVPVSGNYNIIDISAAKAGIESMSGENPEIAAGVKDLAYLIYTSGSTGLPKGVMLEHASLSNLLISMQRRPGLKRGDKLLAVTTVSFDIAGLELYLPLISGACLVLADNETCKDGERLLDIIKKNKISMMQATPSTYKLMLSGNWPEKTDITLLCGGEALSRELAQKLIPRCKALWNMYGPTETCIWSAVKEIKAGDEVISIGRPIDNTGIFILDKHDMLLPPDTAGEICISGAGLARAYLNRPELTEEKFTGHPYEKDQRIYHTGDLGKLSSEGELFCLGRNDQQIKVRGFRIETGEIEFNVSRLEGVDEAVVIPGKWNADDVRLTCFVKKKDQGHSTFNQSGNFAAVSKETEKIWRNELSKVLPEYMLPAYFIETGSFPLTANGKTDRKQLENLNIPGLLSKLNSADEQGNLIEKSENSEAVHSIKEIWEETLGVSNAGINDNFFESGGHSLIGIELMHKIETRLGIKLPLSSLFSQPSISGLAQMIVSQEKPVWKYLVEIKPTGNKIPLYLVHGAGLEVLVFQDLIKYIDKEQPVIAIQAIGLNDDDFPPDTVEEISARYISEIIAHNPDGPYSIAGFSAGSVIAFEIARQLQAMGKKIAFLGNFDFAVQNLHRRLSPGVKIKRMIAEFLPRQLHALKCMILYPKEAFKFQKNFAKLRLMGILCRLGYCPEEEDNADIMEKKYKIMDQYLKALDNYEVKPYDGTIDLFLSKIKIYYLRDMQYLGWGNYALKGIRRHKVEGDHDHMILPPNTESFAKKLQEVMDKNSTQYT